MHHSEKIERDPCCESMNMLDIFAEDLVVPADRPDLVEYVVRDATILMETTALSDVCQTHKERLLNALLEFARRHI
jgi:hypothetical protein